MFHALNPAQLRQRVFDFAEKNQIGQFHKAAQQGEKKLAV
jgi:hypothetical protein